MLAAVAPRGSRIAALSAAAASSQRRARPGLPRFRPILIARPPHHHLSQGATGARLSNRLIAQRPVASGRFAAQLVAPSRARLKKFIPADRYYTLLEATSRQSC